MVYVSDFCCNFAQWNQNWNKLESDFLMQSGVGIGIKNFQNDASLVYVE